MDQAILQTAFDVREQDGGRPTIFVTMDTNLRIRADALGMVAETYENQRVEVDAARHAASSRSRSTGDEIDAFFHEGARSPPRGRRAPLARTSCLLLRDRTNPSHTALGRYDAAKREIMALRVAARGRHGRAPAQQGAELRARPAARRDRSASSRSSARPGTGKTLLALAAGLKRTMEDGAYTRMLVSRPVMPLGRDIGFLPGDVDEKLNPWMQPIFDNLEFLFSTGTRKGPRAYAELLESGQIQVEPLTYIRGRSLPQQYMIVDEAQNLTPHEVKTIITRSGDGTKIVLTGDPGQIDNPYVDSASNGLTIAADKFRGEKLAAHIVLAKGERSDLAELAANLL